MARIGIDLRGSDRMGGDGCHHGNGTSGDRCLKRSVIGIDVGGRGRSVGPIIRGGASN